MSSFAMTVPYMRTSPVHIPRRDLVLAATDNLYLRVTVVDSDNPCAQALELSGGLGGPSLHMSIWRESPSYAWDYGLPSTTAGDVLWSGVGVISDALGAFDVSIPAPAMIDFPRRCGWAIRLDFGNQGSEVLARGIINFAPIFGPAPSPDEVPITTDTLIPITTDTLIQITTD